MKENAVFCFVFHVVNAELTLAADKVFTQHNYGFASFVFQKGRNAVSLLLQRYRL